MSSMGQMLLNERLVEKFLHAKKWLKPGGRMFPAKGSIYVAPFTDIFVSEEQLAKLNFDLHVVLMFTTYHFLCPPIQACCNLKLEP